MIKNYKKKINFRSCRSVILIYYSSKELEHFETKRETLKNTLKEILRVQERYTN